MRRLIYATIAGAISVGALAVPASANIVGDTQGCTPGYWKNHTESWQENTPPDDMPSPDAPVSSIFSGATPVTGNQTLTAALAGGGGPGTAGAEKILMRAAVAAYLNAASNDLAFPWRRFSRGIDGRPGLVNAVNSAIASNNRATMIALATRLDDDNNLGCPLN
jgi:hypothetical protein